MIRSSPGSRARSLVLALLLSAATAHAAEAPKPKFGPHAISIQTSHDYLRSHDAPDYWALSPFYVPQVTGSACALATIVTVLNALIGLPPLGTDTLVSQQSLLQAVGSADLAAKTAEKGEGVTFDEFMTYLAKSLDAYKLSADIEVLKPADASAQTLARVRALLADNERSGDDFVMVYYNQGVVTGDWDGPHLSPIGAYDAAQKRVLIMDVDREFYIPYWTEDETLLAAMLRPAPPALGALAGETGGLVRVTLRAGARDALRARARPPQ
jgi:hypothetical protein